MIRNQHILIADDDETLCYLLKEELLNEGFLVDIVYDGNAAIEKIKKNNYDVMLLDLEMKDTKGEDVLKFVKEEFESLVVVVLTAKIEMRTAINCIKLGAYDFITKPYEFDELLLIIDRALEHKSLVIENKLLNEKVHNSGINKIIGESDEIKRILTLAEKAASSGSNILLESETGTGKELFAEFIHANSERNDKPFVAINCASLPDQLIESELFGYEKGAFTDAKAAKQGLVELADGGTLFLDEIGEMSLALQPKLLRFLENGEYRRVGAVNTRKSNVRVIGATNKNLMEESEKKNFRRDLLFRLNVITLSITPLNKRGQDVILLAEYFLEKKSPHRNKKTLSKNAEVALLNYSFPGNVRELEHIIERSIIFSDGNEISVNDLNLPLNSISEQEAEILETEIMPLEDIERIHIMKTLNHLDWNRENTARALGISQKTLYSKIKKYNLK
ncbi:MAG: sigma-54-dependent Fis family transcriptional regulator [Melioribacteraceae bacterium]|nr:sigma-54-dependent Fis family transcriptional regulator [Melioribacteraceae bacterium]